MPKNRPKVSKELIVPYARGFNPPSKQKQKKAIGFGDCENIPAEFSPDSKLFEAVPKCTSNDDWLAQYNEDGQTYNEFLGECPWLSRRKGKYVKQNFIPGGGTIKEKYPDGKVYIVPLGEFSNNFDPDFDDLVEYTSVFLQLPIGRLPALNLEIENNKVHFIHPESSSVNLSGKPIRKRKELLKSRFHHVNTRTVHQIAVRPLLLLLTQYMPDDAICLIALTMSDLYEDNTDLFVAGMAAGNSRVAVFSLYRYDPQISFSQEFWYDIKLKEETKKGRNERNRKTQILQRGCRLLVHEINHLLGMAHCIYFSCCMNGSGHLGEDFSQPMTLCPVDLRKLYSLVGFDITERYEQLKLFFEKHNFQGKEWLEKRIETLSCLKQ